MRLVSLAPAGSAPAGGRRWSVAASVGLHVVVLALLLPIVARRVPPGSPGPSYDLVFEGSPEAAREHVLPPSQPADVAVPPDAPIGPPAPTPAVPPSPTPSGRAAPDRASVPEVAPSAPSPPRASAPPRVARAPTPVPVPANARAPAVASASAPAPVAPASPAAPATTAPETLALAPPLPAETPPASSPGAPPQAEPTVNLEAPPDSTPAPAPDIMPVPPPPLPPITPMPPRPRAPPSRGAAGSLGNPMDLSFGPVAPRAAARSYAQSRGVDLSLPFSRQASTRDEPYAAIRAANATEDWNRSLLQYWLAHRYYPEQAVAEGDSGTVTIELTVLRSGLVESVRVVSTSGSQWLDMAAVGTFRDAQLRPFTEEMKGDRITFPVPISYLLIRR